MRICKNQDKPMSTEGQSSGYPVWHVIRQKQGELNVVGGLLFIVGM